MKYKRNSGVYDEDHVNEFNARTYTPANLMRKWYTKMEVLNTRSELRFRGTQQSYNNHDGLHHSGMNAFERELERKGIPIEKYPLTTTTGATRVREMVVLRRKALEAKASEALAQQRKEKQRAIPSEWFDETKGPLNPRFVAAVQPLYQVPIADLPRQPVKYESFAAKYENQQ